MGPEEFVGAEHGARRRALLRCSWGQALKEETRRVGTRSSTLRSLSMFRTKNCVFINKSTEPPSAGFEVAAEANPCPARARQRSHGGAGGRQLSWAPRAP